MEPTLEPTLKATLLDCMGDDLTVVNAARVSFAKESNYEYDNGYVLSEKDKKLIKYLADHKHISPFGHCFASFHVKAPVFVARQLVKHKFLRWNEVSRRYVTEEPEFYHPPVWRQAAKNVKQGSLDESVKTSAERAAIHQYQRVMDAAKTTYQYLLSLGVCAEQSRSVLPLSHMTEWYWTGSLDAWADMCILRLDRHTQYESRMIAQQISDKMYHLFPVSWKALMEAAGVEEGRGEET